MMDKKEQLIPVSILVSTKIVDGTMLMPHHVIERLSFHYDVEPLEIVGHSGIVWIVSRKTKTQKILEGK